MRGSFFDGEEESWVLASILSLLAVLVKAQSEGPELLTIIYVYLFFFLQSIIYFKMEI